MHIYSMNMLITLDFMYPHSCNTFLSSILIGKFSGCIFLLYMQVTKSGVLTMSIINKEIFMFIVNQRRKQKQWIKKARKQNKN